MSDDVRSYIGQAKAHIKNQSFKRAEGLLKKVLDQNYQFADVYNMLGIIYQHSGEFSRSIESFNKALKLNPNYTEALLNLSVLYNDLGEYKQARQLIQRTNKQSGKGRALAPFFSAILSNKHAEIGDLYKGLGLFAEAIVEYQKALGLAPTFHDIRAKLALCYREAGNKKAALTEYKRIVKEKAGYVDAHIQLGVTLYSMGQAREAHKIWEKIAREQPKNQLVKVYLRLQPSSNGGSQTIRKAKR